MPYTLEEKSLIRLSKLDWRSNSTIDLDKNLNLNSLLLLSQGNGIFLYVYARLQALGKIDNGLKRKYNELNTGKLVASARHLEFKVLEDKFNRNLIPFIPIKGILLAKILYPRVELREMLDIDLLMRYEDAGRIDKILKELKYFQTYSDPEITSDILPLLANKKIRDYVDCVEFRRAETNLEIHFKMLSSKIGSQIPPEEIWQNAVSQKIDGKEMLILSPIDQLINVASHAFYHNLSFGLRPISEIDGIINFYSKAFNWDKFLDSIREHDLAGLTYIPLYLAKEFYSSDIPNEILEEMRKIVSNPLLELSETLSQNFFSRSKISLLHDNTLYFHIMGQKKWFLSLYKIFIPPIEIIKLKTGKAKAGFLFVYLQYPLRFFRLLKTYLPKLLAMTVFKKRAISWKK